ncbi:hypothetical protein [Moraxella lacunata]|uniref:hypothetical protein n=1 Tax=Moraxella lacunata TaxID=477 RepID=UPI003EDF828B
MPKTSLAQCVLWVCKKAWCRIQNTHHRQARLAVWCKGCDGSWCDWTLEYGGIIT